DAIQAYLDQRSADMKAEMDKIKAMTPDEAKTYMESLPKVDIFADMVSKGVVTQAQADAVKAALPSEKGGFDGENPARGFTRGANVDDWVANGLIDQSTADAIKAYMASDAFKTAVQQPQDGSSAQPGAGMRRMKIDIISLFVDQKLLTQAQADAINAYMQQKADGFKADAAAPGGARGGGQWFRGSAPRTGGSSSNPSAAGSRAGSLGTGRSM
ncbi:MAG: hypothetical protein FWC55_03225, partial [Firmicutes bacterium]|nr:hypothetical protein [Bacillota bacterium]